MKFRAGLLNDRVLEGERTLIAEILAGNHERYYELIAPIERRVYYTAYAILRTEADAEEVSQEAILKGFRLDCPPDSQTVLKATEICSKC